MKLITDVVFNDELKAKKKGSEYFFNGCTSSQIKIMSLFYLRVDNCSSVLVVMVVTPACGNDLQF
jgi:hypothetical protein